MCCLSYLGFDMHDFLGSFTLEEWRSLQEFIEKNAQGIAPRLAQIRQDLYRLGWIAYEDRGGYTVQPTGSSLDRALKAYTSMGGSVRNLNIKSRGAWIYFTRGDFNLDPDVTFQGGALSTGDYRTARRYDDTATSLVIEKYKGWATEAIRKRGENLEFEIKRLVDETDQIVLEGILLVKRSTGTETLETLKTRVEYFIANPNFPDAGKPLP